MLSVHGNCNVRSNEDVDLYGKGLNLPECPEDLRDDQDNSIAEDLGDIIVTPALPEDKRIIKRLYLNIRPEDDGSQELAVKKLLALYPGPYSAFGYNKASGKAKLFGLKVSAEQELINKMEHLLGKENVFVKILEN